MRSYRQYPEDENANLQLAALFREPARSTKPGRRNPLRKNPIIDGPGIQLLHR